MTLNRKALTYEISTLPTSYIPKIEDYFVSVQSTKEPCHKISAFNEPVVTIKEPKLCQWDYLNSEKMEALLQLETAQEITKFIDSTFKNYPKGRPRFLFVQLMEDVFNFCKEQDYDVEKSATVLSQFYHTHLYVTSGIDITAEKVYAYFKELMMSHSLPFPPSKKKVFTLKEAQCIMELFYRIYLRNLPLIKYLCLPNFALYLNYEIPPPPVFKTKEKKKGKGGKEKGKKKKK